MIAQLSLFEQAPGPVADGQTELISGRDGRYGWQIKLARFADGLWRSAPDFCGKDWGFSWPLAADDVGHPSRAFAVEAAAGVIRFHLSKHPATSLHKKALADLDRAEGRTP